MPHCVVHDHQTKGSSSFTKSQYFSVLGKHPAIRLYLSVKEGRSLPWKSCFYSSVFPPHREEIVKKCTILVSSFTQALRRWDTQGQTDRPELGKEQEMRYPHGYLFYVKPAAGFTLFKPKSDCVT